MFDINNDDDYSSNKDGSPNLNKRKLKIFRNELKILSQDNNKKFISDIILPIMDRVIPNIIAHEIISVKSMTHPMNKISISRFLNGNEHDEIVSARSHKLNTVIPFDIPEKGFEDFINYYAQKIIAEFDLEILDVLKQNIREKNMITSDKFIEQLFKEAINIGTQTQRSSANWCIINKPIFEILSRSEDFCLSKQIPNKNISFVGKLKDIKIYYNPDWDEKESALIGYVGDDDSAALFAPYKPFGEPKIIINPSTFEPVIPITSYCGLVTFESSIGLNGTGDYIRSIGLQK